MIKQYKDTKLIKAHELQVTNKGATGGEVNLRPNSGVVFQPDISSEHKVAGEPYKKGKINILQPHIDVREFQKSFMESIGKQRRNKLSEVPSTVKNVTIDPDLNQSNNIDRSLNISELNEGRIDDPNRNSPYTMHSGSVLSERNSLYNKRLRHNNSLDPSMHKNYSFVNSNYDSHRLKSKLMDYEDNDVNKTMDYSTNSKKNLKQNKTSLILPPLSIGNMMAVELRNPLDISTGSKSKFTSPRRIIFVRFFI